MSTNDVPGANPANNDKLSALCWAEHEDGSLILVQSTENNRVIYSVFDMSKNPIIEYRDAMPIESFNKTYSWNPKAKDKAIKWTWHDKTTFPWDKVIKAGFADGPRLASAHDIKTAAERIAENLQMKGDAIRKEDYAHRTDQNATINAISDKLVRAFNELLK
jgi:hypothetical protein